MTDSFTYEKTLDYMYSQLPMYQRQGTSAFKKDLTNILALAEYLDHPQTAYKTIHIAGTNGKGTVAHLIAAGLQANGLKVGLYTSPHYIDFRERIKIDGQLIEKEAVVNFVEQHKPVFEKIQPSFFEMTVAMAFDHFRREAVDIAVIETGLGGRLDSTNIVHPILSVITNISYDHQAMLGDTLPLIAREKAGIIKTKVPLVVGEYQGEVMPVFLQKALEMDTMMNYADFHLQLKPVGATYSCLVDGHPWLDSLDTDLNSGYQLRNLKTALYALYQLRHELNLDAKDIANGIRQFSKLTYYIGRWQLLNTEPLVIADSAHNIAGVTNLLAELSTTPHEHLHIILGMVSDKDISKVLSLLPTTATYYYCKANIPRGLAADALAATASTYGLSGSMYSSVEEAYIGAMSAAVASDLVLVMGSVFVVAEVLAILQYS